MIILKKKINLINYDNFKAIAGLLHNKLDCDQVSIFYYY